MTMDEISARLQDLVDQITEQQQTEQHLLAELGRKALPELVNNPAFEPDAANAREAVEKLAGLLEERAALTKEKADKLTALTCFMCKTVNQEDAAFCEECGAKLGEKPREFCEACETMNHPGQKFCGECGARLRTADEN